MNIPLPFNIGVDVRVQVCQEMVDEHMPKLDSCIINHPNPLVKADLMKIKNTLPQHVAKGDTDMISLACSFIMESFETTSIMNSSHGTPPEVEAAVAQLNEAVKRAYKKYGNNFEVSARIQAILKPLTVRLDSFQDFTDRVKAITAQINNV